MKTYSTFRPTSFDSAGLALDDQQDWLVLPVSRNRDSRPLDESNFASALSQLGGESETVEVHRFGHWACGWLEIIIVKPESDAARIAEEIESALENYPILDDEDFSEREMEEANQVWKQCYRESERVDYIRRHRSQFEFHDWREMRAVVRGDYFNGYASELLH